jgi:undecaprenyl-diphosphatase
MIPDAHDTTHRDDLSDDVDRALDDQPRQRFVGGRDLTRWPTAVGRLLIRLAATATRWVAPNQVLALILVIGLALVGLLTAGAAQVYESVAEADGLAGLDHPVLHAAIRLRTPLSERLVTYYTNLGSAVWLVPIATAFAVGLALRWRQWSPLVLIAVTGLGSVTLTVIGKAAVGRARPPLIDAVAPFEYSYSFPSGHSLNSLAIAGIVAYLLVRRQRRRWARVLTILLAALFAVTIGLSRVYLGHHWLTDVAVAWALALAWLTVVITAHRLFLTLRAHHGSQQPQV